MSNTRITTKKVRFSYVRVFEPTAMNEGDTKKYSVSILIPKTDKATVKAIKDAIQSALELGKSKHFGGVLPKKWENPLRDGDEEKDGAEYQGMYFINAKRKEKQGAPLVINGAKQYITEKEELYSGCYGNVAISLFSYEFTGKYGVGVGLNAIQKTKEGERLDGGASIDDFDFEEDSDMNLFN